MFEEYKELEAKRDSYLGNLNWGTCNPDDKQVIDDYMKVCDQISKMVLLNVGDKIQAVGFPLLGTINDGKKWTLYAIDTKRKIYWFKNGKKKIGHYINEVHPYLQEIGCSDINYFEVFPCKRKIN